MFLIFKIVNLGGNDLILSFLARYYAKCDIGILLKISRRGGDIAEINSTYYISITNFALRQKYIGLLNFLATTNEESNVISGDGIAQQDTDNLTLSIFR